MFDKLTALQPDPILGLSAAFREDNNPDKIDLGVGVYKDEHGNTPILASVAQAQQILLSQETSKTYITPQGHQGYIDSLSALLLGANNSVFKDNRVAAVQAPGGCGALRILAELLKRANPDTTVWVSDPTWANHIPLIGNAGLALEKYPYFDMQTGGVDFAAMINQLSQIPAGDVVLLHACCHNPTGADLTPAQWDEVAQVAADKGWIPFIDSAYLGFGDGLEQDAYGMRAMVAAVPECVIAASCSKNFGLYRERVGLAIIISANSEQASIAQGQIQNVARGIYSMPPSYGGALVDIILHDENLAQTWVKEVNEMRTRMQELRQLLVEHLHANGSPIDFSFLLQQKGMFSYLCITPEQVRQVRREQAVYFVDSSRINVAGINKQNVARLAKAIVAVL